MNTITQIEAQKKNKNRVNVYVDGQFLFACSAELVYTHGLKKDKTVEVDKLLEVVNDDNYLSCKNSALRMFERSYKTEKEISDKLLVKGYDEGTISKVIIFLKEYSFLDDEKFTDMYIKDNIKTKGKNKIKYDLMKKGVSKDILAEKLEEVESSDEMEPALRLAEKKYRTLLNTEGDQKKTCKKLGDFLIRKGYNYSTVKKVLSKVLNKDMDDEF